MDRVDLEWDQPTCDSQAPVIGYIIEKKSKHGREWAKAADIQKPVCKGTASGLKAGEEFQFRVRAVNKAGPGEPSGPSSRVTTKAGYCRLRFDTSQKPVTHLWVSGSGEVPKWSHPQGVCQVPVGDSMSRLWVISFHVRGCLIHVQSA